MSRFFLLLLVGYGVRFKIFDIPSDYVPGVFEIIFSIVIVVYLSVVSLWHLGKVIEIPPVPKKVVLESAVVYRDVSTASKTMSKLYLRIGPVDEAYNHIVDASTQDIKSFDFNKSRKLWVAVESDRSKRFVWGVYDSDLGLLISRKDIVEWAQYNNSTNYFVFATWFALSLLMLFMLFKHGLWNRFLARRMTHEDRSD